MITTVKERPILFSGPMVRAIRAGRKTQTRRIINRLAGWGKITEFGRSTTPGYDWCFRDSKMRWHEITTAQLLDACPYGKVGEQLWGRESMRAVNDTTIDSKEVMPIAAYAADGAHAWTKNAHRFPWKWERPTLPSIHMPRELSRIQLENVFIGAEQVQEINEADAQAEGFYKLPATGRFVLNQGGQHFGEVWPTARYGFQDLWSHINGAKSWEANPFTWKIEFKVQA